ncbi:Protein N-acetyltransferase, RimJ/RimL family [Mucilaginibacter lappiensis]|uniref:RimJ/RimL family protein N-acetyltransferase n=1 Tax=Mucilaginibacter lappiensis TaxID=354630 RepID=A0ABR6PRJ4_9SPHI|nr:GNAT family N-acetyltransferase [Mucilaginibacter lappiensis]MBB6111615.1 RimJ/RimL family protein N-acetyltransferase [Mucilaginibacter lappiensis]SIR84546.1 Protein N-acetyltransferase, RimJ/RimL family [Mucilaginibacter lappiensis]
MINHLTKNGISYCIRQVDENDAEQLIAYSKNVFASTNQLLTTPEEYNISVADEKVWINNIRKSKNSELLIATLDHQVIGFLFFIGQQKAKNAHVGELGINVHPGYQAMGIGRALMETLIKWVNNHNVIEKIVLEVFATNHNAIKLYYSLGFKEEGRFVKAIKQKNGEYVDVIQMYLFGAKG